MNAKHAIVVIAVAATCCAGAIAQDANAPIAHTSQSESPLPFDTALPDDLIALLAAVKDGRPNFDVPAYYALVRYVQQGTTPPELIAPAEPLANWSDLADQPSEYRGKVITIRGLVGRNKSHRYLGEHADLGQVWQLELRAPGQPMSMTVICTDDVSDVPIDGEIVISGYFLMLRQFQTASGKIRYGGLMIAGGPTRISTGTPLPPQREGQLELWIGAVAAGLLVAFLLIRRRQRGSVHDIRSLRSENPAPLSLADDLAEWSRESEDEMRE